MIKSLKSLKITNRLNSPKLALVCVSLLLAIVTGGCNQHRFQPAPWQADDGESPAGNATTLPSSLNGTTLPGGFKGTTLPGGFKGTTLPGGFKGTTLPGGFKGTTLPRL